MNNEFKMLSKKQMISCFVMMANNFGGVIDSFKPELLQRMIDLRDAYTGKKGYGAIWSAQMQNEIDELRKTI